MEKIGTITVPVYRLKDGESLENPDMTCITVTEGGKNWGVVAGPDHPEYDYDDIEGSDKELKQWIKKYFIDQVGHNKEVQADPAEPQFLVPEPQTPEPSYTLQELKDLKKVLSC